MNIQLTLWEQPEEKIPENDNYAKWKQFHEDNPEVYDLIKHYTFQAIEAGHKKYGIQTIAERVRWHSMVETVSDDRFKLNNNHTAYYARLFMKDYPQHAGFFRTRKLTAQGAANDSI